MNNFEQFKTLESTQAFLQWIPDDCKNNLLIALDNIEIPRKYKIMVRVSERWEYQLINHGLNTQWDPKEDRIFPLEQNRDSKQIIWNSEFTQEELTKIISWNLSLTEAINVIKVLTEKCSHGKEGCMTPFKEDWSYGEMHVGSIRVKYTYDYELSPGQK